MSVNYSLAAINARLGGVVTAIDSGGGHGRLNIYSSAALLLIAVPLATPSGGVAGGILTLAGTPINTTSLAAGTADRATITNSAGVLMVSGLTVGLPLSGANLTIDTGRPNLAIGGGEPVTLVSGQIIGA